MPGKSGNVFRLWEELKRRRVVRVVLIYLAAAYAILESSDIILPRLGLADWTVNLVMVALFIGLIIVIILSWIYDITPEGIKVTDIEDGKAHYQKVDNLQNTTIGNYEIKDKLNVSGLGVMYSGVDIVLGRQVTLVFLTGWICSDRIVRARILEKAQAAAGRKSDNQATIFSVESENGFLFFVLDRGKFNEESTNIPDTLESIIVEAIKESSKQDNDLLLEDNIASLKGNIENSFEAEGVILSDEGIQRDGFIKRRKATLPGAVTSKRMTISAIVIIIILIVVFNWSGIRNILGIGNKDREIALSHVIAGEEQSLLGNWQNAKAEFEIAVKADPTYSVAWSNLAAACANLGAINEAVMHTIKAVELDDSNIEAAYNLAYALDEKEDYEQAIEWYSKAVEMDSSFLPAYSALGRAYNLSGQPVKAILVLRNALNKFPESDSIYLVHKNIGYSYLLMDQLSESKYNLDLAMEANPYEPETVLFSARCYEAALETAKAIELWENYISLETDSAKIIQALDHLKAITTGYLESLK